MSSDEAVDNSQHFATPTTTVDTIDIPARTSQRFKKVDKEGFLKHLKEGYTQAEAYRMSTPKAITDGSAYTLGSALAGELLSDIETKNDIISALDKKRWALLDGVTPQKIATTGVKDLFISIGIATEKIQLLSGQPTEQVAHLHLHADIAKALSEQDLESKLLG